MSDLPEQNQQKQEAVSLVDPGVPADQGLSSLGLLMQLAGSVFAAFAALGTFVVVLTPGARGEDKLWILLILALCVTRSMYQRLAGSELLYGHRGIEQTPRSPLWGVKLYVVVGLIQTVVLGLLMVGKFHVQTRLAVGIGLGLASWPIVLAVLSMLPRFKRFDRELPVAEDKGFEAAAILMVVLGTTGVLGTGAFLLTMLDAGGRMLTQGPGVLVLLATVMLLIRSVMHVTAGLAGLRDTSVDLAVERANRYANFGVISSFCAGGALLLLMMSARLDVSGLAMVAGICWLLLAWPMIIRRFFSERQFADLLAGDNANLHRRAPDAGLSGLGWLLFGHAMFGAAMLIPQLVVAPQDMSHRFADMMAMMGPAGARSLWWSAGLLTLQAWAGFELVRMGSAHRMIATVYAVVAVALTMYLTWPLISALKHIGRMGPQSVMMFVPVAIQLVMPVATLLLVNRAIAPTARARFRSRATEPTAPTA